MPSKAILFLCFLIYAVSLHAEESGQVMLFGTFHFQDPGKDMVKSEDIDVFAPQSQAYLQGLAERLSSFKPTKVLLEYGPEYDDEVNQRYHEYLAGEYELGANEIYQLGFRIARLSGLERVHSFDNQDVQWKAEALFEYAEKNNSPEMDDYNDVLKSYAEEEAQARAQLSLRELLIRQNDPEMERRNMDAYLLTNSVGAGDGYAGAVATASWWERNFRMYANIQKLAGPGERIIAIGGSGHMAILKQFLDIDGRLQEVNVIPYF